LHKLLHNGADITYIKELAGHSDIQTTAKYYLGVDRDALRNVVDKYLNFEVRKSPSALDGLPAGELDSSVSIHHYSIQNTNLLN